MVKIFFKTSGRSFAMAVFAVLLAGAVGPKFVYLTARDGGFERAGLQIDLSTWRMLRGTLDGQAAMHTDMTSQENGQFHHELWINSGQALRYMNVPVSAMSEFVVAARVHPAWAPVPPMQFQVVATGSAGGRLLATVAVPTGVSSEWQMLTLDLQTLSGQHADIEIRPLSPVSGTWTLWRDPAIQITKSSR